MRRTRKFFEHDINTLRGFNKNKIKSVMTRDFIIKQNDYEIFVFMKHGIKYEFSMISILGDFVNNGPCL